MTEVWKADFKTGFVVGQSDQAISGIDKLRRSPLTTSYDIQRGRDVDSLRGAHQARYFLPVTQ